MAYIRLILQTCNQQNPYVKLHCLNHWAFHLPL